MNSTLNDVRPMIQDHRVDSVVRRIFSLLSGCALILVWGWSIAGAAQGSDLVFVQIPAQSSLHQKSFYLPGDRYVDGMRIVRHQSTDPPEKLVTLTPEFFSACDPAVSFDGRQILFAGKKNQDDSWQIWRMGRDGSAKTRLTSSAGDCVAPLYVGALFHLNDESPTDQIAYLSSESGWINECGSGACFSLYSARLDGSHSTRITYNLSSDFAPDVLPNGRLVYSSWKKSSGYGLMAVNNDGADMLPFYVDHSLTRYLDMVHIAGDAGRAYMIASDPTLWLGGGDLAYVTLRRPLHSYQTLSHEDDALFHSPCATPDGELIASYRKKDAQQCFSLYQIDPDNGQRIKKLYSAENWHCVDAQSLTPHAKVKGRSSVVNLEKDTGVFFCLNVYESQFPEIKALEPGTVKRLRVIEGLPLLSENARQLATNSLDVSTPQRILGVVPLEQDGSFHLEIPSHIPVRFQLLDEHGLSVAEQHSWTYVMPREWRGCIGCHEDRELAPPNHLVQAVAKKARKLTLPPNRRRTVDFVNQIKPILQAKCSGTDCHSDGGVNPDLDVNKFTLFSNGSKPVLTAYESLLESVSDSDHLSYVVPGSARSSLLMMYILGEHVTFLDDSLSPSNIQMPPKQSLTALEKALLIEWIDLGALYDISELSTVTEN